MKRIMLLAGAKSHGPGEHEYEKGMRLFARVLARCAECTIHLNGWPEDEKALDQADAIVLYADGSDHRESDHPLLLGNRLTTLERQLKRGCGFVALHEATFAPHGKPGDLYLEYLGGHFDYQSAARSNHWISEIKLGGPHVEIPDRKHPICRGVSNLTLVHDEWYYGLRLHKEIKPLLTVRLRGSTQTIAWARERKDGGRGFAFTGGHWHGNWVRYQRLVAQGILWAAHASGQPALTTLDDPRA